jgi:hypothetical protein
VFFVGPVDANGVEYVLEAQFHLACLPAGVHEAAHPSARFGLA